MDLSAIKPGKGYIVREYINEGRWKQVFRAVYRGEWEDRALLRFKKRPSTKDLLQELEPLHQIIKDPPKNVARVYGFFLGEDESVYMVEELIYMSLNRLSPLTSSGKFLRIAYDLSCGLGELHKRSLVHRDLKLDNCGIDYGETAKIFDLGLGTSENSKVKGTLLTRAPDLFADKAKATKESDVWALGATLFALRVGDYPFVTKDEVAKRPIEDGPERQEFDSRIREKTQSRDAETSLQQRVISAFPKEPAELISRMLAFNPKKRPTAEEAKDLWETMIDSWLRPGANLPSDQNDSLIQQLQSYLVAIKKGDVGLSAKQWGRTLKAYENLSKSVEEKRLKSIKELLDSVGNLREG